MRLSGGSLGGRSVVVPRGVRPTAARAREALFDIWGERVRRCRFLDLFAGSGAIALEALSRGASTVLLVEGARPVLAVLRRNLETLEPPGEWRLRRGVLPEDLGGAGWEGLVFDLIFADPPYAFDTWEELLTALEPRLAKGGEAVLEHGRRNRPPEATEGLKLAERRVYGESELSFYRRPVSSRGSSPRAR